jgi:DNA-binding response OmpR family regulator
MLKDILLLEDDVDLAETICELLEDANYSVDVVHSGADASDKTFEQKYRLYIFDINVPDINGLELLEALRNAQDPTPAIFISALVDIQSIAKGFAVGGEDYIKKPFFPEELLIRVNARLQKNTHTIEVGKCVYDPLKKVLRKDNKVVSLGEVQRCLADLFFQNINKVLDKTILLECMEHPSEQALRVAITKLKQTTQLPIKNIRGVGYILEKS